MAPPARLAGKVAIVTGAASGIGAAIAARFRAEDATVVACDVADGEDIVSLDVADEAGWARTVDDAVARHGRLDILVNNAGIVSHQAIDATTIDAWNRVIAVNLTGAMLGCRAAIAAMRASPGGAAGSIVNVGSTTSFLGLANDCVYTASKAGVIGLTRSIATWCAREGLAIRCNSLHPGATRTEILARVFAADPAVEAKVNAMCPMNRMAHADEIANLALYLASDESSFSTGAQFVADGGLSAAHPAM